jgi:hypothetical protein
MPSFMEMKPEKLSYYRMGTPPGIDESDWLRHQWLINHFAIWNGKKTATELEAFQQAPVGSYIDTFGVTFKASDLPVHALSGRFFTREIVVGLRDYVQWKVPGTEIFDRIDFPIDIPTVDLNICVVIDLALFEPMGIAEEEISSLALEIRNRENARFEGKEVALYPGAGLEEQYGRSPLDDGADLALLQVRRLKQRVSAILHSTTTFGQNAAELTNREVIDSSLSLPQSFLFYTMRWPSPHLGIQACVRWEKPLFHETRDAV